MSSLDQNINRADREGFEVLGAPIGTETHHAENLSKRVEKTEPLLDRVQQLDDPHNQNLLFGIQLRRRRSLRFHVIFGLS